MTFKIYWEGLYLNPPSYASLGMEATNVVYQADIVPNQPTLEDEATTIALGEDVNDGTFSDAIDGNSTPGALCSLDVEVDFGDDTDNRVNYNTVISQFRQGFGSGPLGYYNHCPDFWAIGSTKYASVAAWQTHNDFMFAGADANGRVLRDYVTVFNPVMYTTDRTRAEWETWLLRVVAECRRLDPTIPIIPYLWPQYGQFGPRRVTGTISEAFTIGDTVTGDPSGDTAVVTDQGDDWINVRNATGTFATDTTVTGATTGSIVPSDSFDTQNGANDIFLPTEFWEDQMELCRTWADGFIIWNAGGYPNKDWTEEGVATMAWFLATETFVEASVSWPNSQTQVYSTTIEADNVAADETDFQAVFRRSDLPDEMFDPSGTPCQTDGGDIRAALASDGSDQIPCYVHGTITLDSSTGAGDGSAEIWCKLDVSGTVDTDIHLAWGTSGTTEADPVDGATGRNQVFANWAHFYRLDEASGDFIDLTGNDDLTPTGDGITRNQAGPFSFNGVDLAGSADYGVSGTSPASENLTDFSILSLIDMDATQASYAGLVSMGDGTGPFWSVQRNGAGNDMLVVSTNSSAARRFWVLTNGWSALAGQGAKHMVLASDGDDVDTTLYVDGAQVAQDTASSGTTGTPAAAALKVGAERTGVSVNAILSMKGVTSAVLDANYASTHHAMISDPGTFFNTGTVTDNSGEEPAEDDGYPVVITRAITRSITRPITRTVV